MSRAVTPLRVLHLASFAGNIGDLANHAGARGLFARTLDFEFSFVELEIREFYWRQRSFDDDFVRYANGFDLLLVGGGNYFELWVQDSPTGTSIAIDKERLAALRVPVVFHSLGVDIGQGYTDQTAARFRAFMGTVLASDRMYTCVRNDGSSLAMQEVLGTEVSQRVRTMPDGGFFATATGKRVEPHTSKPFSRLVGINIAGDMLERRFEGSVSAHSFLAGFARACTQLLEARDDLNLEFVPHIWRDITVIAELLPMIPDRFLRSRIGVAPLRPVASGLPEFLGRYQTCDLVLGMRFHANVCPIGMSVPTLGLLCYPQVAHLYRELGLQDRLVDVRIDDFSAILVDRVLVDLDSLGSIRDRYRTAMSRVHHLAETTLADLNAWLHGHFD